MSENNNPKIEETLQYIVSNMATKDDIKSLETKVDGLEMRIDSVENNLTARLDKVEDKVNAVYTAVDHLGNKIDFQESERAALDMKVDRAFEWLELIGNKVDIPQPA